MKHYVAALSVILVTQAQADDWKLAKEKDNIRAYTRSSDNSDNYQYRAETTIHTTIDDLLNTMRTVEQFDQWLFNCYDPALIEKKSDDQRIVYMKNKTPFIVMDRDVVLEQTILHYDGNHSALQMQSVEGYVEPQDDLVRLPKFEGVWDFVDLQDGTVKVSYTGLTDPGGMLPAWVSNMLVIDIPYESMKNLRSRLEAK